MLRLVIKFLQMVPLITHHNPQTVGVGEYFGDPCFSHRVSPRELRETEVVSNDIYGVRNGSRR